MVYCIDISGVNLLLFSQCIDCMVSCPGDVIGISDLLTSSRCLEEITRLSSVEFAEINVNRRFDGVVGGMSHFHAIEIHAFKVLNQLCELISPTFLDDVI